MWALAAALLAAITLAPDEVSRLEGHSIRQASDGNYTILDIAKEGKPLVGVVERRDDALWLRDEVSGSTFRLVGPLARPRIAGPGYRVWVIGEVSGTALRARRLGVLSPPAR